jgi:hypothetical protein
MGWTFGSVVSVRVTTASSSVGRNRARLDLDQPRQLVVLGHQKPQQELSHKLLLLRRERKPVHADCFLPHVSRSRVYAGAGAGTGGAAKGDEPPLCSFATGL